MQPWSANFRKQMRQMPNLRYTARDRPHKRQRRFTRVENFGVRFARANLDLLATAYSPQFKADGDQAASVDEPLVRNGIPNAVNSINASSSLRAEVPIVIFIPCTLVNLSGLISGNTNCSVSPML